MAARARRATLVLGLAIACVSLAGAVGAPVSARDHLGGAAAKIAAKKAVLADSTYRVIDSPQPLRTRRCWRAAGGVVHCSLYRIAGTPCALQGDPPAGGLCVQVLARRTWLVEVRPGSPPHARILRILDGPA